LSLGKTSSEKKTRSPREGQKGRTISTLLIGRKGEGLRKKGGGGEGEIRHHRGEKDLRENLSQRREKTTSKEEKDTSGLLIYFRKGERGLIRKFVRSVEGGGKEGGGGQSCKGGLPFPTTSRREKAMEEEETSSIPGRSSMRTMSLLYRRRKVEGKKEERLSLPTEGGRGTQHLRAGKGRNGRKAQLTFDHPWRRKETRKRHFDMLGGEWYRRGKFIFSCGW